MSNKVADALSIMYEEEATIKSAFILMSKPILSLLEDVKHDCKVCPELASILQQLEAGKVLLGYTSHDGNLFL